MRTLNKRIFFIFIIFSLTIIFSISTIFKLGIEKNFNAYVEEGMNTKISEVVSDLSYSYRYGKWNIEFIEGIGMSALEKGLIVKVTDIFDKEIWDANTHNSGMCKMMISNQSENMHKVNPKLDGKYTVEKYPLNINGVRKGNIEIGYYGPFSYSDSEVQYFNSLNKSILIITIFAIAMSFILGIIVSKSINKPIYSAINIVNSITRGNYKERINSTSNIKELDDMIKSINTMASNLDKQQSLRKTLTKDISHELRTPITIIVGQLEAIRDGIWEPSEERINGIYDEIQRLNRLIYSLDDLAKLESEDLALNKSEVNIKSMIEKLFINFEKELLDKNIIGELELEECNAFVDKDKLSQGIVNLISNAIRYTESGGRINIKLFTDQDSVNIIVKDTGMGIKEEHLDNIFERFYRTDESRTRVTGGSGVGLSITKAIIEAHGGKIRVNSKVNCGSKFIIELPRFEL